MSVEKLRLDKWLWFARFCKTRGLAQELCESGHIKLNGASVSKASQTVKVGDGLEMVLHMQRRRLTILALGTRRGPAPEAQALYEETTPPDPLEGFRAEFQPRSGGRPTKKDRRATDALKPSAFEE